MLQSTKEAIALEITKARMTEKSECDLLYQYDDAFNWVLTFKMVIDEVNEAVDQLNP